MGHRTPNINELIVLFRDAVAEALDNGDVPEDHFKTFTVAELQEILRGLENAKLKGTAK